MLIPLHNKNTMIPLHNKNTMIPLHNKNTTENERLHLWTETFFSIYLFV